MEKIRIMIVEDEWIIADDIRTKLEKFGYEVSSVVDTGEEAIKKAEEDMPDLVLMDIVLPGEMDGIEAADEIHSRFDIPVIYLTSHADERTLERARITEPFGYLLKPVEDRELHTTIEMALYKYILERKLKESEEWLYTTLRSIGDAVIATDKEGFVKFMNTVSQSLTGWKEEDAKGKPLKDIFNIIKEETGEEVESLVKKVVQSGKVLPLTNHSLVAKDRKVIPIDDTAAPIRDDKGNIIGVVIVFHDITERKRFENELKQKLNEIERINKLMVDRELKMEEMRKKMRELEALVEQLKSRETGTLH